MTTPRLNPVLRHGASLSLIALIALCLVWELWLAPLRPGGSWLVLKVLPLLLPLRGVLKGSLYTLQWASMLILLYFMEGVVRMYSDPAPASAAMAGIEVALSLAFYLCAIFYLRPAKRAAKAASGAGGSRGARGAVGASEASGPSGPSNVVSPSRASGMDDAGGARP